MIDYPIIIYASDGRIIDRAGNVESAASVLYGTLSLHDGSARRIVAPAEYVERLEYHAEINADCWNIPLDVVETAR